MFLAAVIKPAGNGPAVLAGQLHVSDLNGVGPVLRVKRSGRVTNPDSKGRNKNHDRSVGVHILAVVLARRVIEPRLGLVQPHGRKFGRGPRKSADTEAELAGHANRRVLVAAAACGRRHEQSFVKHPVSPSWKAATDAAQVHF